MFLISNMEEIKYYYSYSYSYSNNTTIYIHPSDQTDSVPAIVQSIVTITFT